MAEGLPEASSPLEAPKTYRVGDRFATTSSLDIPTGPLILAGSTLEVIELLPSTGEAEAAVVCFITFKHVPPPATKERTSFHYTFPLRFLDNLTPERRQGAPLSPQRAEVMLQSNASLRKQDSPEDVIKFLREAHALLTTLPS